MLKNHKHCLNFTKTFKYGFGVYINKLIDNKIKNVFIGNVFLKNIFVYPKKKLRKRRRRTRRFKNIEFFYINSLLNQKVKNGKKKKYYNIFLKRYYNKLKSHFYKSLKTFRFFIHIHYSMYFLLNKINFFWKFNNVLRNFIRSQKRNFFFFNVKKKIYVNHKKKYYNEINFFLHKRDSIKHHFFKYLKILFLKKKCNVELFFINNFYKEENVYVSNLHQKIILNVVVKKLT